MRFNRLRDLLAAKNWEEADSETANIIFTIANVKSFLGYLSDEQWNSFPCEDLQTIDRLWVDYSNGHFGFSVQKEIYQRIGVTSKYNPEIWRRFGKTVGWCVNDNRFCDSRDWIGYHCTFDLTALKGHLPVMRVQTPSNDDSGLPQGHGWSFATIMWYSQVSEWHRDDDEDGCHRRFSSFMSKFISCNC